MKARIPYFRTAAEKKAIHKAIMAEYQKIEEKKRREMAERCLKIFLYVLNRDYHFGAKRANDFYTSCGQLLENSYNDEVFWEHVDKVVIDQLGIIDFKRDYTVKGKAVRE